MVLDEASTRVTVERSRRGQGSGWRLSTVFTSRRLLTTQYNEKMEILALNLNSIKSEEDSLRAQKLALVRERNLHVREIKRISDEEAARYHPLPHRLTDRYLLMSLLGRGGFSEVYKVRKQGLVWVGPRRGGLRLSRLVDSNSPFVSCSVTQSTHTYRPCPKAFDLRDCRYVACKIHQLSSSWSAAKRNNYIKHATREYEIHKDLKHERIVELFGAFRS